MNSVAWAKAGSTVSLSATPAQLSFSFATGGAIPAAQTISFSASGGTPVSFNAASTASAGWLRVTPVSGATPATLTVTVAPAGLAPGTYSGEVAITAGSVKQSIPVTLTVVAGSACSYQISPVFVNLPLAGGTGEIGVSTQSGCAWTAISNSPWTTISAGPTGTGPGTVRYNVGPNAGSQSRQG